MSDFDKLIELRISIKEISAKLIFNVDEQGEILELIQRFETYQQALLQYILSKNNNEALIALKDLVINIQKSLELKDWVFLNQIIRNDFELLEERLI